MDDELEVLADRAELVLESGGRWSPRRLAAVCGAHPADVQAALLHAAGTGSHSALQTTPQGLRCAHVTLRAAHRNGGGAQRSAERAAL